MWTTSKLWIINFISLLHCAVSQWALPAKEDFSGLILILVFISDSGLSGWEQMDWATAPQCLLLASKAASSMASGVSQMSNQTLLLTRSLCSLLLFHPVVICWIVSIIRKGYPRPCDADAGVPVVIITHPPPREIRGSPGFRKLAHSARGHSIVALRRHICRISVTRKEERSVFKEVLKIQSEIHLGRHFARLHREQNPVETLLQNSSFPKLLPFVPGFLIIYFKKV